MSASNRAGTPFDYVDRARQLAPTLEAFVDQIAHPAVPRRHRRAA